MRFSLAWLTDWVNPEVSADQLAHALSMAGLEVDSLKPAAPDFNGVVIGEVLSCEPHPNADKLSLCSVNMGADEPVSIICGASNVRAGIKVPVARIGAVLPGNFKIKKAKLRGVTSYGMICSAAELGLAENADGIMILPDDAPIGVDFRDYLQLDDDIIEVDLTPNRGDCLSIAGLAKEVGVIYQKPVKNWIIPSIEPQIGDQFSVQVQATEACPRYLCRVIKGIDAQAQTPLWMQERLRRSGIRSISPIVDITNFVMLELGQPMHAFDLDKLQGGLQVRMAAEGEKLCLLDGSEISLKADTLLIADEQKPLALAGIMGGLESGVTEQTQNIVLEAAFFAPTAIIGKARQYGLHTDSSHRFERGVDFNLANRAMERATELVLKLVGGQAGPVNEWLSSEHLPQISAISLRRQQIKRLLGIDIADELIVDILQRLGMNISSNEQGWQVIPPSSRFDIRIEADLIEEIGRIYGYDRIESGQNCAIIALGKQPEALISAEAFKQSLIDLDYQEIISYSFISPKLDQLIYPEKKGIPLSNPISQDLSIMRVSLWPGLLNTLQYNLARQQERIRLFELGQVFWSQDQEIEQPTLLAGLIYGDALPEQWAEPSRRVDFYDLKGDIEHLLQAVADEDQFQIQAAEIQPLHPGQTASLHYRDRLIGYFGALHPEIQKALAIPQPVYLFEFDLAGLQSGHLPQFQPISKYPSIRRDLALVVDKSISWQQIEACVRRAAPEIVRSVHLFDVYSGSNIEDGSKSFALSLILQAYSHTLKEDEVEQAIEQILQALADEYQVKLRE